MESFFSIIWLLCLFSLAGVLIVHFVYDLISKIKKNKLDELRRDRVLECVEVIAGYCFYDGLTKGYEMRKTLEDINKDM